MIEAAPRFTVLCFTVGLALTVLVFALQYRMEAQQ